MYSNHKAPRRVSRRVVLGTAAGAGVAGAAAAIGIAELTDKGSASAQNTTTAGDPQTSADSIGAGTVSPVVVYVDPSTRAMMLFVDEQEKSVNDDQLADLVLKAAGKA